MAFQTPRQTALVVVRALPSRRNVPGVLGSRERLAVQGDAANLSRRRTDAAGKGRFPAGGISQDIARHACRQNVAAGERPTTVARTAPHWCHPQGPWLRPTTETGRRGQGRPKPSRWQQDVAIPYRGGGVERTPAHCLGPWRARWRLHNLLFCWCALQHCQPTPACKARPIKAVRGMATRRQPVCSARSFGFKI